MLSGSRIPVGTDPTVLAQPPSDDNTGISALVRNRGTVSIDLGGASVSVGNGFELGAGDTVVVRLGRGEKLYGVAAAAGESVHVLTSGID